MVLIEPAHSRAEAAIPAVALRRPVSNGAEKSVATVMWPGTYPDDTASIFDDLEDGKVFELRMRDQLATAPTRETLPRSDPEGAVTRAQQSDYPVVGKRTTLRRLPMGHAHTVEAHQAGFCPQPQEPVLRLSNRCDVARYEALPNSPGSVRVLADIKPRIQGQCVGTLQAKQTGQQEPNGGARRAAHRHHCT